MIKEDLGTLSTISRVLWVDPEYSSRNAIQALSAVALLDLNADQTLEKTCSALLEKARTKNLMTNAASQVPTLGHDFYRLLSDERFVLVALHLGQWTYARVGRILGVSVEEVQDLAWRARVQLSVNSSYPAGPASIGMNCPEYDSRKPWTQRFLDDEMTSAGDLFFLQNHLLACRGCSDALKRSRELYFRVEKELDQIVAQLNLGHSKTEPNLQKILETVLSEMPTQQLPLGKRIAWGTLHFLFRKDISLMIVFLVLLWFLSRS
jgi:hypothetical protein